MRVGGGGGCRGREAGETVRWRVRKAEERRLPVFLGHSFPMETVTSSPGRGSVALGPFVQLFGGKTKEMGCWDS